MSSLLEVTKTISRCDTHVDHEMQAHYRALVHYFAPSLFLCVIRDDARRTVVGRILHFHVGYWLDPVVKVAHDFCT